MRREILVNFIRFYFLQNKEVDKKIFFCTLTFPPKSQTIDLKLKLQHIQNFMKALKDKYNKDFNQGKSFDYIWVKEGGIDEKVHFHIITNWNYSWGSINNLWNRELYADVKLPSTKTEEIKSLEDVANYITKEDLNDIGMSKDFRIFISGAVNSLKIMNNVWKIKDYNKLELFLNSTKKSIIVDLLVEQNKNEFIMFEKYLKKDKAIIIEWLKKLKLKLKEEKLKFIENISKCLGKSGQKINILQLYIKNIMSQKEGFDILWSSLLFFFLMLTSSGKYEIKMQANQFYMKFFNLLINNISKKIEKSNEIYYMFLLDENKYLLGVIMLTYIEHYLEEYIEIKRYIEELKDSQDFIRIRLKKQFQDIKIEETFFTLKGWNPMLVEPKDWVLKKNILTVSEKKKIRNYKYGGYLNNGKRFFRVLSKDNSYSQFEFLNQKALDVINKLQKQELKINKKLLKFISMNKEKIVKELFKFNKDMLHKLLKGLDEKKIQFKKDRNSEWKEYYKEKALLISELSKLDKLDNVLKVAQDYSNYEKFYFVYEVDFRGRIYAISDYLNYQGDKLARNLIYFFQESKFDLYWFKIFCVRKYGFTHLINSADNMINYFDTELKSLMIEFRSNNVWFKAEDTWSFLNCCLEYENYLLFGDNYKTGMPIYFDATCSGSQLVALLFGIEDYEDVLNLNKKTSQESIGDFYLENIKEYKNNIKNLIDKVNLELKKDSLNNIDKEYSIEDFNIIVKLIKEDKTWRKFMKHILMTKNYGLTKPGLYKKLQEKNKELRLGLEVFQMIFLQKTIWQYFKEHKIFKSLDIISDIVKDLSKFDKSLVIMASEKGIQLDKKDSLWLFKQRYHEQIIKVITYDKTFNDILTKRKKRITHQISFIKQDLEKIDEKQQALAVKANLIHFLDSLWIYMLVLKYVELKQNINILPIHDCFGVLMHDIVNLNTNIREVLTIFFQDRENLLKLLLQLERHKLNKLSKEDKEYIEKINTQYIGNLKINLSNSYYLIFPG